MKRTPKGGTQISVVEADETFVGKARLGAPRFFQCRWLCPPPGRLDDNERGGDIRSKRIENVTRAEVMKMIRENVDPASTLHTDGAMHYKFPASDVVAGHESVDHSTAAYVCKGKRAVEDLHQYS